MKRLFVTGALLVCLGVPHYSFAQVNASAGGTVSDATGALIPGVAVTATNINTGIMTTRLTNESGVYEFPSLQPGVYTVSAVLTGFQRQTFNSVQLSQGQQVRLNFTLKVGTVAQAVDVVIDADTQLATTTSSVGAVLPDVEVRSLPMATRNVLDLTATTPGVLGGNFGGGRVSQINTTRDGLPTGDSRYLDQNGGAYSTTFVSPDLVEEVQVTVNTIDPSVGRGSAQVRLQTRSGGNDFHGALFYTNTNSALGSNNWFNNLVGQEKSYTNQNQFGGRLGGPIKRNKAFFFVLFDGQRYLQKQVVDSIVLTAPARNGIFRYLTANTPGGTTRRNGNAISTTPSVDLNGNVLTSDGGVPLFQNQINVFKDINDPNNKAIDQVWVASQMLPHMPLPNDYTIGDGLNTAGFRWRRALPGLDGTSGVLQTTNRNNISLRGDYQINTKNKVSYSQTHETDWGVTGQTGIPDYPNGYYGDLQRAPTFYSAAWTSTVSSTVLNEARWGYKRDTWFGTSAIDKGCCRDFVWRESDLTAGAKQAAATFPKLADGTVAWIAPGLGIGNYAPLTGAPRTSISPLLQFADTLTWTKGAHTFQGGGDVLFQHSNQAADRNGSDSTRPRVTLGLGNFAPNVSSTNFSGLNASDVTTVQNLLANLAGSVTLLGQQYYLSKASDTRFLDYNDGVLFSRDFHQNDWSAFFKDNWKVTKSLTLNLGIRYDKFGSPYEANGLGVHPKGGNAGLLGISGSTGALTVLEYAGKDSPNPGTLIFKNDWNNFAPAVGFSWNVPWSRRPTVLRGGYGMTYTGAPTIFQFSSYLGSAPGSALALRITPAQYLNLASLNGSSNVYPLPTGGVAPFVPVPLTNRTTPLTQYDENRVTPYVQSWNLSIQRELARSLTLQVSYVGNKGTKLWGIQELNNPNLVANGILNAFNVTRAGGTAPLFDRILNGQNVPSAGLVNGTTLTGSEALRRYTITNQWLANGEVSAFANWLNSTNAFTGVPGGLLRNGNLTENAIVLNPQFSSLGVNGNTDNSIYHSMQAQLTQRLSHGISGQFSYTWSRNLGNSLAGSASALAADTTSSTRDPNNRQLQRGLVAFDRTHQFQTHGTWVLPFGPGRTFFRNSPSLVQRLVEGWDVAGILNWVSGAPLNFVSTRQTLGSVGNVNTADLVSVLPQNVGTVQKLNGFVQYFPALSTQVAPFPNFGGSTFLSSRFSNQIVVDGSGKTILQNPQPGTTGNTAWTLPQVTGPSQLDFDLALTKQVRIAERKTFSIRADAINVLNKPQFGNPNTDINSATFGRIRTASGQRLIIINARVDF